MTLIVLTLAFFYRRTCSILEILSEMLEYSNTTFMTLTRRSLIMRKVGRALDMIISCNDNENCHYHSITASIAFNNIKSIEES